LRISSDVTDRGSLEALCAAALDAFGKIDILVNCAGRTQRRPTLEVDDAEWQAILDTNLTGTLRACQVFGAPMLERGYGRIVNIASIAGKEGNPMAAAYSASKAAVIGMTKSFGKDLVDTGILVNSVAPAVIRTPILEQMSQEHVDYMVAKIPLGRLGEVEEVAELVAYLASERCTFATGACFDISGGRATY
jgi:3-oxoacyl-[acyl-carrier protein] reductase